MDLTERIRTAVAEETGWTGAPEELAPDHPLLDEQVLDSMSLFTLVTRLESDFGVTIDDEELVPDHFETIEAIATFIDRKQSG
jgi:acyl carrier protein